MTELLYSGKLRRDTLAFGRTIKAGATVAPVEALGGVAVNNLTPLIGSSNVVGADLGEVASLFESVSYGLVKQHAGLIAAMEAGENEPRPEMLQAIKNEALRRRSLTYHKQNGGL